MKNKILSIFLIACFIFIGLGSSNTVFAQDENISIKVTSADIETIDVSKETVHPERDITIPPTKYFEYEITFLYKKALR